MHLYRNISQNFMALGKPRLILKLGCMAEEICALTVHRTHLLLSRLSRVQKPVLHNKASYDYPAGHV